MNHSRDATPETSRARAALTFLLKSVLAGVLLFWLIRSGRLDFSAFSQIQFGFALTGMFLFQAGMFVCQAARWHLLAQELNLHLHWRDSFRISFIGFFAAMWTPASLGLDGARLLYARRLRPQQTGEAVASVVWDRVLGVWSLFVLCALSGAMLWQYPLSPALRQFVALACCASFIAAILGIAVRLRPSVIEFLPAGWRDALATHLRVSIGRPLIFSFATHVCNAMALWCALRALSLPAPIESTLSAMPLIILSSLAPLTPLGLGVTDAAAVVLLQAIGVAGGAEATMLARSSFMLLSAACGAAWLGRFQR